MSLLSKKVKNEFVKNAFLVKFGNLYILPEIQNLETFDVKPLISKILECLNDSSLIRKVETIDVPPKERFFWETRMKIVEEGKASLEAIRFTPFIKSKITLPIKSQEQVKSHRAYGGMKNVDATADFGVLYNGSIYAIFRKVDLSKRFHSGAPDIRDFFISLMEKEKSWEVKSIPPNPLRQDFYFVYLIDNNDSAIYVESICGRIWNSFIFPPK